MTLEVFLNTLSHPSRADVLPLFHTTSYKTFLNEIIPTGRLIASRDKKKKPATEPLIFLFYGSAKFQENENLDAKYKTYDRPISLLYDYDDILSIARRLFPFDSGGKKLYENALATKITQAEFEINFPRKDTYVVLANYLYESNKMYVKAKMKAEMANNRLCMAVTQLYQLNQKMHDLNTSVDFDRRAFTFEAQYVDDGKWSHNPACVFVPTEIKKSEECQQFIRGKFGSDTGIISYLDKPTDKVSVCYEKMQKAVEQYVRDNYLKR